MIWQHASLVRRRSVLANVAAGALGRHQTLWTALGGLPADGAARRPATTCMQVGLARISATQRAGTLSGGQAQRVAIARALAQRPRRCWPTNRSPASIPRRREEIMRLLRRLAHQDGLAVLCVLHQVDLAFGYADRVVGMRDGRVAFDQPRGGAVARRGAPALSGRGRMSAVDRASRARGWPRWGGALGIALRTVGILLAIAGGGAVADRRAGAAAGPDHRRPRHGRHHLAAPCRPISRNCPTCCGRRWRPSTSRSSAPWPASAWRCRWRCWRRATSRRRARSITCRAASSASPARCPTWSGRCCSSPPSGSARSPAAWRWRCIRSACSAGCSPRRSRTWTWRRSRR